MDNFYNNSLKSNIIKFLSESIIEIQKKLSDPEILKNYSLQIHKNILDHFFDLINFNIESFYINKKEMENSIKNELIFCTVCLVDESFIFGNEKIKNFWVQDNLESRFYNSQSGGDLFFANLKRYFESSFAQKNDYLLIYYICLKAGFRGNLKGEEEELKKIRLKLYSVIENNQKVIFPIIEKNRSKPKYSFLSSTYLKLNMNIFIVNVLIFLFFILFNTFVWNHQVHSILSLFKQ